VNKAIGVALLAAALVGAAAPRARAEVSELRAAQQYGLSYLALMVMEDQKLVEKKAKDAGLDLKVTWAKLGGPAAMNDALLSGNLDFASGGVPGLITLWSKTKDSPLAVKGVGALNNMPVELITSNPNVKSIKDFTDNDKIAVTSVKVSTQAMLLEQAAAQTWGKENYAKLDPLTVSLPHPEAMTALLSGSGAITAHFASPPFSYTEKAKGMRVVAKNYDILGGPATFNVVWTTSKFVNANPKAYAAFASAFAEATDWINKNKSQAAELYKRMANTSETIEQLLQMLNDPEINMTLTPSKTMVTAGFMAEIGTIKQKPSDWKELFFPNVHTLPGS
jgi:NitT/TauT family transport system substrate-binding protein